MDKPWAILKEAMERIRVKSAITGAFDKDVGKLYLEMTVAMLCALFTVLAFMRIVPYMTSAITFFVKFCICTLVLSITMQLMHQSELFIAIRTIFFGV